jgi:hypothetical protein
MSKGVFGSAALKATDRAETTAIDNTAHIPLRIDIFVLLLARLRLGQSWLAQGTKNHECNIGVEHPGNRVECFVLSTSQPIRFNFRYPRAMVEDIKGTPSRECVSDCGRITRQLHGAAREGDRDGSGAQVFEEFAEFRVAFTFFSRLKDLVP